MTVTIGGGRVFMSEGGDWSDLSDWSDFSDLADFGSLGK